MSTFVRLGANLEFQNEYNIFLESEMKVEGSHLEAKDGGKKKASFEKHQMEDIEDKMRCQMDFTDMYEVSYKFNAFVHNACPEKNRPTKVKEKYKRK